MISENLQVQASFKVRLTVEWHIMDCLIDIITKLANVEVFDPLTK